MWLWLCMCACVLNTTPGPGLREVCAEPRAGAQGHAVVQDPRPTRQPLCQVCTLVRVAALHTLLSHTVDVFVPAWCCGGAEQGVEGGGVAASAGHVGKVPAHAGRQERRRLRVHRWHRTAAACRCRKATQQVATQPERRRVLLLLKHRSCVVCATVRVTLRVAQCWQVAYSQASCTASTHTPQQLHMHTQ